MPYKDPAARRAANRRHYERNADRERRRVVVRRERVKQEARDLVRAAKEVPCADCGGTFSSVCMDFDHQGDKTAAIAKMVSDGRSLDMIEAEIAKCEIVCSNCHRIRTWL